VLIEPPLVNGVRGFTVTLTLEAANALGHRLISAATRLRESTTKTSRCDG
jgi:hypothetical protein